MTTPLKAARFDLDEQQVAAALSLGRIALAATSALPDVPPPPSPAKALAKTGVLADGGLTPEADAALRIAASPARLVSVVSAVAGSPSVLETVFLTGAPDGPVVAQALGERVELALLPSAAAAAVAVDELLHLTDVPVESGQEGWSFSLGGYAALLAFADGVQRSYLEARLARRPYPRPSFTAEALQGLLDDGLAATDTRWAVTAAKLVTPVDLASARSRLASGMDELVRARLAERGRDGSITFTEPGYEVAAPLGQLLAFGTVTVRVAVGQERTVLGHTTVLRGMFRIFLGTWTFEGEEAQVRLTPVSALTAIEFVRGMFEAAVPEPAAPAPAPAVAAAKTARFCPQCGTPTVEGRSFCGNCGTEVTR